MSSVTKKIQKHLGSSALQSPVIRQEFELYERPNVHVAIEELMHENKSEFRAPLGIVERDYEIRLSRLVCDASEKDFSQGPVEYVDVELGPNERLACVKTGVYLFTDERKARLVLLVHAERYPPKLYVEIMGSESAAAEAFLRKIVVGVRAGKSYRGRVFSLDKDCYGTISVKFHQIPSITRKQLILPQQLLERIERHTISFTRHATRLQEAGRHLKRGILLHGPPGTGKTLSAMYLASRMSGRTVVVLTWGGMGSIEAACHLARLLEPATVILEDVDLIGTERGHQTVGANALLFELLNQMDGLNEDCDVLFVLTTNRPDVLEPALSSRPGRIDQALEISRPVADCRKRLIALYGQGLKLSVTNMSRLVSRLDGASAAFIRELLRKAALLAADENDAGEIAVEDHHVEGALEELLIAGGNLTLSLLGAQARRSRLGLDEKQPT